MIYLRFQPIQENCPKTALPLSLQLQLLIRRPKDIHAHVWTSITPLLANRFFPEARNSSQR